MSSETDDLANVVQLVQPDNEERKLLNIVPTNLKTYQQKHCKHTLEVSEVERTITCIRCGCVVDPFEFILERAHNGERVVSEIETLAAILYAENECKNVEQKAR